MGWLCCCPGIVWERANTQLVGEHSATVVAGRWATMDWSWSKELNWCAQANLHLYIKNNKKAGNEWLNILPKVSQGKRKPPPQTYQHPLYNRSTSLHGNTTTIPHHFTATLQHHHNHSATLWPPTLTLPRCWFVIVCTKLYNPIAFTTRSLMRVKYESLLLYMIWFFICHAL